MIIAIDGKREKALSVASGILSHTGETAICMEFLLSEKKRSLVTRNTKFYGAIVSHQHYPGILRKVTTDVHHNDITESILFLTATIRA